MKKTTNPSLYQPMTFFTWVVAPAGFLGAAIVPFLAGFKTTPGSPEWLLIAMSATGIAFLFAYFLPARRLRTAALLATVCAAVTATFVGWGLNGAGIIAGTAVGFLIAITFRPLKTPYLTGATEKPAAQ